MDKAEYYCERVIDIKPIHLEAIETLLFIYKDNPESEKTRKYVEHGLKYYPDNLEFKRIYGLYLLTHQFYEEARELFANVLEKLPDNPYVIISHAFSVFQSCGILKAARKLSKISREEDPQLYKELKTEFRDFSYRNRKRGSKRTRH